MKPEETTDERGKRRPRNKANMNEPAEEFIEPDASHWPHDGEHGDELRHTSHQAAWESDRHAA